MNQTGSIQNTTATPRKTHLLLFAMILGGLVGASVVNFFSGNTGLGFAGIAMAAALTPIALRLRLAK